MDREIIVKRLGEMTLAICEMQDVINRLSAENAKLRDEQASLGGKNEISNLAEEEEKRTTAR